MKKIILSTIAAIFLISFSPSLMAEEVCKKDTLAPYINLLSAKIQDIFTTSRISNIILDLNSITKNISTALLEQDFHTALNESASFLQVYENTTKDNKTNINLAVEQAWQHIHSLGTDAELKSMDINDLYQQLGFHQAEMFGLSFAYYPEPIAQLVRSVQQQSGNPDKLWNTISSYLNNDLNHAVLNRNSGGNLELLYAFHPSFPSKAGIYYNPNKLIDNEIGCWKFTAFHEELENIFSKQGIQDRVFHKYFKHCHPRIIEEEFKFAERMNELEEALETRIRQVEVVKKQISMGQTHPEDLDTLKNHLLNMEILIAEYKKKLLRSSLASTNLNVTAYYENHGFEASRLTNLTENTTIIIPDFKKSFYEAEHILSDLKIIDKRKNRSRDKLCLINFQNSAFWQNQPKTVFMGIANCDINILKLLIQIKDMAEQNKNNVTILCGHNEITFLTPEFSRKLEELESIYTEDDLNAEKKAQRDKLLNYFREKAGYYDFDKLSGYGDQQKIREIKDFQNKLTKAIVSGKVTAACRIADRLTVNGGIVPELLKEMGITDSVLSRTQIDFIVRQLNARLIKAVKSGDFSHPMFKRSVHAGGTDEYSGIFWADFQQLYQYKRDALAPQITSNDNSTVHEQRAHAIIGLDNRNKVHCLSMTRMDYRFTPRLFIVSYQNFTAPYTSERFDNQSSLIIHSAI